MTSGIESEPRHRRSIESEPRHRRSIESEPRHRRSIEPRTERGFATGRMVAELFPAVSGRPAAGSDPGFRIAECPTCRILLRTTGFCGLCGEYVVPA